MTRGFFPDEPTYPHAPGWRDPETSREAAEAMEPRAGTLRAAALAFIRAHPHHTSNEIAAALHETELAMQPRISELRAQGLIINDGRGRTRSGRSAHLWIAT
jgi:predicted transcriptional regulator